MSNLAVDNSGFNGARPSQLELRFNRIELNKKWSLAPSPKRLNGYWATHSYANACIVERLAAQFKGSAYFSGARFHRKVYLPIISSILANLLNAYDHGLQIIYSRNTGNNLEWINVWDFLVEMQFVNTVIADKSDSGVKSWAVALPELISLLHQDNARIVFDSRKPSIEIRDSNKKALPVPQHRATNLKYNRSEKDTAAFNSMWEGHTVTLDKKNIVPYVRRLFNGSLNHGGRFYGDFQRIPSKDRKRIKIDGQATIELDFSCIHLAILYAWQGIQIDYDQAYILEGYDRETVKAITLRMLNIESVKVLKRAITLSANPRNQDKYTAYKTERAIHDWLRSKGLRSNAPNKPPWIDSFIENIPSNTDTEKLIEAFMDCHSDVEKYIGSKSIGLRLQAEDSKIMALVLNTLRLDKVLALPVHDSIIIQKNSSKRAELVMRNCFKKVTGFHARIK